MDMGASQAEQAEITITLHISPGAWERLARRAAQTGQDVSECVSTIVEHSVAPMRSLEEISGPLHEQFLRSGMTEDELGGFLEEVKHQRRAERRAEQAT
jgi:hypothetical protein